MSTSLYAVADPETFNFWRGLFLFFSLYLIFFLLLFFFFFRSSSSMAKNYWRLSAGVGGSMECMGQGAPRWIRSRFMLMYYK